MTHHLHICIPDLNYAFFLDVANLDELKTTFHTLNCVPNIPVRTDKTLINDCTSVEELLENYNLCYGQLITITLLENEDDDPDLPTRELSPFIEVLWYQSRLSASEAHPLLTLPDITALCAMAEVLEMKPDSVNLMGALYGAYRSVLHRQVQVVRFAEHGPQLTIKVEPFGSIDQALAAQGAIVNP